jgi:ATP-binding cassette subfamily B protein RaxB
MNTFLKSVSALPSILQTEASECGLASLAMISSYHGAHRGLSELRRQFAVSLKGATLKEIVGIADAIGLAARPLRLELDELGQLKCPCILHWDLNHFVVLARVASGVAIIHDPAAGVRRMEVREVSRHFTGVAVEFTPTERFDPIKAAPRIAARQLLGRMSGLKQSLVMLLSLALAIELLAMMAPMFLGWVVDHALVSADRDLLTTLALGFLLLLGLQTGLSALRGWSLIGLNASLKVQSRANLFSHLVNLPTSFFEARHLGDVMSRFASQDAILQALTSEMVEAVLDGLMAVITLIVMFVIAPDLAAIILLGAAVYALIRWVSYAPLRRASMEAIVWGARRDSHFLETLRGIRAVKLFGAQEERRTRWLNLLVETINRQVTSDKLRLRFKTSNALLLGLLKVLVIWIGARKVLDGGFSIGLLLAFIAYKDQFLERVSEVINKTVDLSMLRLHAERLGDIALTAPENRGPCVLRAGPAVPSSIELRDVRFRYGDSEPWILDGLSVKFRRGESVAIVGPSGGGKTTLLKVLSGLVAPAEGEILINGEPLKSVGLDNYRAMLGVVMQDDQMFSGSIAENIAFFDTQMDMEWMITCAKDAAVHDDIMAMPMKYETLIGDMGTVLSGGQKQRALIARALYRRPGILLLDEATSHLDVDREMMVNATLRRSCLTRIVIAHRPETIRAADRVVALEAGRLVEQAVRRRAPA